MRNPKPIEIRPDLVCVGIGTGERLQELRQLGFYYREQLEGAAEECVYLLGQDPNKESWKTDLCREIVLQGTTVEDVLDELIDDVRETQEK